MKYIHTSIKFIILSSVLVIASGCESNVFEPVDIGDINVSFQDKLIPIWSNSCVEACHSAERNLAPVLEPNVAYANIIGGGLVVPGNAEASMLYRRLVGDPEIRNGRTMPIAEKLPDSQIQLIRLWIEQGAQNN
jgi:hypothetical protein